MGGRLYGASVPCLYMPPYQHLRVATNSEAHHLAHWFRKSFITLVWSIKSLTIGDITQSTTLLLSKVRDWVKFFNHQSTISSGNQPIWNYLGALQHIV